MPIKLSTFIFAIITSTVISGCSSHKGNEVACNFVSGATVIEHDKDSSFESDFFSDIFLGLLNVVAQGVHRVVSSDSYENCTEEDVNSCIGPDGNIKKECTLTK